MAKTNISPVKAVTFDIGNVLVRWDPRFAYAPLFKNNKGDLDFFLNEVCSLAWHTKHDQGMSFVENMAARQKDYPQYSEMIAAYETEWDNMFGGIIKGSVKLLHRLKALDYPLFALTNFPAEKYDNFEQQYDFMALFQDVIVSGREKLTKPDPQLYQILLGRVDLPAEQILFIDDRPENLEPARVLGLQTLHFTNPEKLQSDMKGLGILS